MSNLGIIKNDKLIPEFDNVNGFFLENDYIIFTGKYVGELKNYMTTVNGPFTLSSNNRSYLLESATFTEGAGVGDNWDDYIVYKAKPV